jgi:hypothetical protein
MIKHSTGSKRENEEEEDKNKTEKKKKREKESDKPIFYCLSGVLLLAQTAITQPKPTRMNRDLFPAYVESN